MASSQNGHSGCVLSLDVSPLSFDVASGTEKGELCVWSMEAVLLQKYTHPDTECTSVLYSREKYTTLYAAFGKEVLIFDTDNMQSPVFTFISNQDEVNQLALDDKEEFLAACDDGGEIKVYGLQDRKVFKTLRFKHTNLCSSVVFRSKQRPWELLSGGLDCRLIHWNFARPQCINQFNMQELHNTQDDASGYLVNPPFIHHLARNKEGTLVAAALENGMVTVFDSASKHLTEKYCLQAHHQGVSQVHFTDEKVLVSAGNDSRIVLWNLKKAEPLLAQGNEATNGDCSAGNEEQRNRKISDACRASVIEHTTKVNWLAPFLFEGNWFVMVADQTKSLVMYTLALQ